MHAVRQDAELISGLLDKSFGFIADTQRHPSDILVNGVERHHAVAHRTVGAVPDDSFVRDLLGDFGVPFDGFSRDLGNPS